MRAAARAPIVIAQPGIVYGRGDHSGIGGQLKAAFDGSAPFVAFGDLGISPAHVDDVASGIMAALDRGRAGESYVMAGGNVRLGQALSVVARAAGRRPPLLSVPTAILRLGTRLAPAAGGLFGLSPNLVEILRVSAGVTYWASSAKATTELGYRSRDLADGAREAFGVN